MSGTRRITERFAFAGGQVDRAAGVIRDCLICGLESENGRDYPWAGPLGKDIHKYEGAVANCDHGREDTIDRRLGWWTDVGPGPGGKPRGTFHLLQSHPMAERVLEAAEKNPRLFGFSHVVEARTCRKGGREIVEGIDRVISIDLVAGPATTTSLFESRNGGAAVPKISLAQFEERFGAAFGPRTWAGLRRLREDMGDMAAVPAIDEPAGDAAAPGDLKAALIAALMPLVEEAFETGDGAKAKAALGDFINLHKKHKNGGDPTPEEDKPAAESRNRAADAIREAIDVCRKLGLKGWDGDDLETIAASPAARREAVARKLLGTAGNAGGETPVSRGRRPVEEGKGGATAEAKDGRPKQITWGD